MTRRRLYSGMYIFGPSFRLPFCSGSKSNTLTDIKTSTVFLSPRRCCYSLRTRAHSQAPHSFTAYDSSFSSELAHVRCPSSFLPFSLLQVPTLGSETGTFAQVFNSS